MQVGIEAAAREIIIAALRIQADKPISANGALQSKATFLLKVFVGRECTAEQMLG